MPKIRERRRPVATPAQIFRAISVGAVFALAMAWTLRGAPAGAAPTAPQIIAEQ